MLTRDELPIQNPCNLDFSAMTRAEANRRFCGACKKHVHDLTAMTEAEARALLNAPVTEGLCVRYLADDRGRIAFKPDVAASRLRNKSSLALAALAAVAPLALTACMGSMRLPEASPAASRMPSRQFELVRGSTRIVISDAPGELIDSNAPGLPPVRHPFLSGYFSGDVAACAEARGQLALSSSTADYVQRLQTVGFTMKQVSQY